MKTFVRKATMILLLLTVVVQGTILPFRVSANEGRESEDRSEEVLDQIQYVTSNPEELMKQDKKAGDISLDPYKDAGVSRTMSLEYKLKGDTNYYVVDPNKAIDTSKL